MLSEIIPGERIPRCSVAHRKPLHNVGGLERTASLVGGGALAISLFGRRVRPALIVLTTYLLSRGVFGQDPFTRAFTPRPLARRVAQELRWSGAGVTARTIEINRTRDDVYSLWRDPSRLCNVLSSVERIEKLAPHTYRWTVIGPFGARVQWNADIVADEPGRRIAWRSARGSDVKTVGEIEFLDNQTGRGTVVTVKIAYESRGGELARGVATLIQKEPAMQARRELRRVKQFLETGEVTTARRRRDNRRRESDKPKSPFVLGPAASEARI